MSTLIKLTNNDELTVVSEDNKDYIKLHRLYSDLDITLAEFPLETSDNDQHNIKIFIQYVLPNLLIQGVPCSPGCESELFYIGKGGFSIALWFKCFDNSCNDYRPIILKMFKPNKLTELFNKKKEIIKDVYKCLETNKCIDYQRELFAAKLINNSCPFICNYYGYFLIHDNNVFQGDLSDNNIISPDDLQLFKDNYKSDSHLQFFFLEYMDFNLKSFYSKIDTLDNLYNKDVYINGIMYIFYFLYDICLGLDKLNKYNLIHCDIKLDNIMIKYNKEKTHFYFVIIDLGSPSVYDSHNQIFLRQGVHSRTYVDFEFIKKKNVDKIIHDTFERDTWALGITLLNIISNISSDTELKKNINKEALIEANQTNENISTVFSDLVTYINMNIGDMLQNLNKLDLFDIKGLIIIVKSMMALYRSHRFVPTQILLELNKFILQDSGLNKEDKYNIYNHIKHRYTTILTDSNIDIYNEPILSDLIDGINKYLNNHITPPTLSSPVSPTLSSITSSSPTSSSTSPSSLTGDREVRDSFTIDESIPSSLKSLQSFENYIK